MNLRSRSLRLLACIITLSLVGCWNPPGRPGPNPRVETLRPDQVLDFSTLYANNCAGCHGASGRDGAALSLANPVYLAYAGESNIEDITAKGVPGSLMPAFSKESGGLLTDQQIRVLAQGMLSAWGKPAALSGQVPPPYTSSATGNAANGSKAFATYCARCHSGDATGTSSAGSISTGSSTGHRQLGSLIDPSYLALISNQDLRSIIVSGAPQQGMPDWRGDASSSGTSGPTAQPMSDQQIQDIVAWLASFRVQTPGQPYGAHQ